MLLLFLTDLYDKCKELSLFRHPNYMYVGSSHECYY